MLKLSEIEQLSLIIYLSEDPRRVTPPILGYDLTLAAEKHRQTTIKTTFVKDILLNMFLIIILSSIAYSNRDHRSYHHHEEIVNTIVTPWKLPQFTAVSVFLSQKLYILLPDEFRPKLESISYNDI